MSAPAQSQPDDPRLDEAPEPLLPPAPDYPQDQATGAPLHEAIEQLAYALWQARGCPFGSPEKDWTDAEEQLRHPGSDVSGLLDSEPAPQPE